MLYQTVTMHDFIRAFEDMGRSSNFSLGARRELFSYYDDLSYEMPGGIEFDPIGICCEWGEYTAVDLVREFGYLIDWTEQYRPYNSIVQECEQFGDLIEYLQDNGNLIIVEHIGEPDTYLFSE